MSMFRLEQLTSVGISGCLILAMCSSISLAKVKKTDPEGIGILNVGKGINFYSLEKEIALGKEMAQDVERDAKVIRDPVIAEYVNRLGQNLVRNSDAKVLFTIKVLDSADVNAFALPGGFFFVNSGLILAADSEAELAAVMSHEIAHVAARHGTRQATRGQIANYASIPLVFMGGWAGYAIQQAAGLAIPMGFLKFSRAFESEADRLGLEYMDKAGYDPTAFVDFFEKMQSLERAKPGFVSKVFSTHPATEARIRAAQSNVQDVLRARPEYVVNTSEFIEVKQRLTDLENGKPLDLRDTNRPRLRRANRSGHGHDGADEDERPTLKRRRSESQP